MNTFTNACDKIDAMCRKLFAPLSLAVLATAVSAIVCGPTANAATGGAPTPGNFTEFPKCAVVQDSAYTVQVTLSGAMLPHSLDAAFLLNDITSASQGVAELYVNGVKQSGLTVPASTTVDDIVLTIHSVSALHVSGINTQWTNGVWDGFEYRFATIEYIPGEESCVLSTNPPPTQR